MLSGGGDIDPAAYGAAPHPLTGRVYPGRDRAEAALLAAALAAGLPVLAICRGLQIINVSRGGTLRQHLPDEVGHHDHGSAPGTYGSHPVRIAADSAAGRILGPPDPDGWVRAAVPTSHHQAIGRLGDGLVATAWADDGTIEAAEPDREAGDGTGFLLAVQWHPEAGDDPRLFEALIDAALASAGCPPWLTPGKPPQACLLPHRGSAGEAGRAAGVFPLSLRMAGGPGGRPPGRYGQRSRL